VMFQDSFSAQRTIVHFGKGGLVYDLLFGFLFTCFRFVLLSLLLRRGTQAQLHFQSLPLSSLVDFTLTI
jgi:hypothetical protein